MKVEKKIITLFVLLSFLNFCCTTKSDNLRTKNLQVKRIIKLPDIFSFGTIVYINNNKIILSLIDEKSFFISIGKNNSSNYTILLKKGKGPDEYLFLSWVYNLGKEIVAYDVYKKQILELKNGHSINSVTLKTANNCPSHIYMLDTSIYIATGLFHKGRFGIFNSKGDLLRVTGYYPIKDSLTVDNFYFGTVYQSQLKGKPDNSRLMACITPSSQLLEIFKYDKNNNMLKRVNKINLAKSIKYKKSNDNMKYITSSKSFLGNISFSVTNFAIYILFNKNIGEDLKKDNKKEYCKEVRVFDWNGNLVKKYHLEKPAVSIYVYDNELYALGMNDKYNSEIDVYKLKD